MRLIVGTFIIGLLWVVAGALIGLHREAEILDMEERSFAKAKPVNMVTASADTVAPPILHLPVEGTWRLIRSPGHERFAFDLVAVDETLRNTRTHSRFQHILGRAHVEDAFSWDEPVSAPISGTVVQTASDMPDRMTLSLIRDLWSMVFSQPELNPDDISSMAGNHVIIRGEGFYVFLAHLRQGTVRVEEGDEVVVGDVIGHIGNSGHSLVPHLHLQLFDQVEDLLAADAPAFVVAGYERWTGESWKVVEREVLSKGDVIRSPEERYVNQVKE